MISWLAFERAAQDIVSKTITLNLATARAVLDKTLFRGNELIRGGSDPCHVLRVFTKLLPNARGVSKEALDSDQAALKAIFKASGGTKAVTGSGFGVAGGGTRTRREAAAYSQSSPNYGYMSTAPGAPHRLVWVYTHRRGCTPRRVGGVHRQPSSPRMSGLRAGRRTTAAGQPAREGLGAGPQLGAAGEAAVAAYPLPRLLLRPPRRPERLPSGPTITPGCRPSKQPSRLIPRGADATTV